MAAPHGKLSIGRLHPSDRGRWEALFRGFIRYQIDL
jgi:hypothetical protein